MVRIPFFSQRRDEKSPLPTHNGHSLRANSQSTRAQPETGGYIMRRRPTIMQWIKLTILDLVTMAILGALALVIFRLPPVAKRTFPVTHTVVLGTGTGQRMGSGTNATIGSGDVVYPQFAYPYRPQFIPSHAATLLASGVPILVMLLAQIRVQSFWDLNNGIIGLIYSLITSALFQVMIKWLIGGLRPNFLDVCKPDISLALQPGGNASGLDGTGYGGLMYTSDICTEHGEGVYNSLESFPSGHTAAAFAGFVYLYLYLNAKLKVFSNYHPALWKLALTYAPILGAVLIGGSLTVDQSHNWYDIITGGLIGTMFAFSSYRMVYVSVWDWRTNHIPLHRRQPFSLSDDTVGVGWTMTRKAGWGAGRKRRHGFRRRRAIGTKKQPVTESRGSRYSTSPGRNGRVAGHGGPAAGVSVPRHTSSSRSPRRSAEYVV